MPEFDWNAPIISDTASEYGGRCTRGEATPASPGADDPEIEADLAVVSHDGWTVVEVAVTLMSPDGEVRVVRLPGEGADDGQP